MTSASSVSPMRGLRFRGGAWPSFPAFSKSAANDSSGRSELMVGFVPRGRILAARPLEVEAGAAGDDDAAQVEPEAPMRVVHEVVAAVGLEKIDPRREERDPETHREHRDDVGRDVRRIHPGKAAGN